MIQTLQTNEDIGWQPPIDVQQYDRTPTLSATEVTVLNALFDKGRSGTASWPRGTHQALNRLLRPIKDALILSSVNVTLLRGTQHFLLYQMHLKGTTFWAWDEQEWLCCIRSSRQIPHEDGKGRLNHFQHLIFLAYVLCGFNKCHAIPGIQRFRLAQRIFGVDTVQVSVDRIYGILTEWGYGTSRLTDVLPVTLGTLLLAARSPRLEDISLTVLQTVSSESEAEEVQAFIFTISRALASLGMIPHPLPNSSQARKVFTVLTREAGWQYWIQRWYQTSALPQATRTNHFRRLGQVDLWIASTHPEATDPAQWNREIAADFVTAVLNKTVGDWVRSENMSPNNVRKSGQPIAARTKNQLLNTIRIFFLNCQEWEWIPRHFDPRRSFATPSSVRQAIFPSPRVIDDDIWLKLLAAGLNLVHEDLPQMKYQTGPDTLPNTTSYYPLEMVQALVAVWLFAALRKDEIRRLRVGCVRWQHEALPVPGTDKMLPKDAVCFLDVPVNKTGAAFTKPVDPYIGRAIATWEAIRPPQPPQLDRKTGQMVNYLFSFRGYQLGNAYLNDVVIPMLCRKAGVPEHDARGRLTSHRGRATIVTQLLNRGWSLFELQEWLGHKTIEATQHYAKRTPTKLAMAYHDADIFRRNLRMIDVLVDQEAIKSGAAASGEPYMYYDLGHGYCTNDFFAQCPHRMACARCDFYRPKSALLLLLEESKIHLIAMKQDLKLTDDELAAIDGDLAATDKLITGLSDVPTPAGPTPRQLDAWREHAIELAPSEKTTGQARSVGS